MANIFSTPELALGIAVGGAAGAAFEPKLEVPKQTAWAANPQRLPDLGLIASLVAGGKISLSDGENMGERLGFPAGTVDSLVWLAQNRLDFPQVLQLWRRFSLGDLSPGAFPDAMVDETLAHDRLDWGYEPYLKALKTAELVGLGDIAFAVVRGILPDEGILPVAPPATTTNVQRFPQVNLSPVALAAALGYSEDQLKIMVGRSGLSMAPNLAAQGYFRGILADDDYQLAIAEGDLRTEWGAAVLDTSRQILTSGQYAELQLRGFSTEAERQANTAKHGMSTADSDLLYNVLGRAISVHQITTGLARGGTYNGDTTGIPEDYLSAMERSNIRPEYYNLAYANRFTIPSYFVLKALLQSGAITEAQGEQYFLDLGWPADLASAAAAAYATTTTATTDATVKKAQNHAYTVAQTAYVNGSAEEADVTPTLTAIGVPAASQTEVIAAWDAAREITRKALTPAQVKKAVTSAATNPATGVAWTQDDALAALIARGYSANDARTFLEL
jgi:hypothetical protein